MIDQGVAAASALAARTLFGSDIETSTPSEEANSVENTYGGKEKECFMNMETNRTMQPVANRGLVNVERKRMVLPYTECRVWVVGLSRYHGYSNIFLKKHH